MPVQTPTLTRNLLRQVVVLSSDPKGTEQVEWQSEGDINGGDYQHVSDTIVGLPQFTRLLDRGVIEIVDASDEVKAALDKQKSAFHARLAGATKAAQDSIDPEAKNDMLSMQCVGPDGRGTGQCDQMVPVREKTKDERPPLCSTHSHLSSLYVAEQQQVGTEIKTVWLKTTMGPRETAQN